MTTETLLIIALRVLLPLTILRWPLAGGILALIIFSRSYSSRKAEPQGKRDRASVPYGIAIAAGGMFVVGRLVIS